jgi:hypothetical protein
LFASFGRGLILPGFEGIMEKRHLIRILVGLLLFSLCSNVQAFDGKRKGFILGIGAGCGSLSLNQEVIGGLNQSTKSDREQKLAVVSDFKIGFASDDQWALYYTSKVSWFRMKRTLTDDATAVSGLGAVAVRYWFKPQAPSAFLACGAGFSTWSMPFEDDAPDVRFGPGLFAGGGFEFSPHWSLEAHLSWGKPTDGESGTQKGYEIISFMLNMNVLGY